MNFIFLLLIIVLDKDVFLFYLPLKTNNIGTKNKEKPLETSVSNGFLASQEGFEPPTSRRESLIYQRFQASQGYYWFADFNEFFRLFFMLGSRTHLELARFFNKITIF